MVNRREGQTLEQWNKKRDELKKEAEKLDPVKKPKHYQVFMEVEAKEIIQVVLDSHLTNDMSPYQIYCLGNTMKYRLRAGGKDDLQQDIDKADQYKEMANAESIS